MTTSPDRSPGAVLLDIDGTLVDSNYLHVHAWTRAFAEVGHPVDAWRVHRAIGMGASLLLAALLGEDADRIGPEAKRRHTEHYADLADLQRPFPGARELVRAVADRGARAVLATSAGPDELERLLAVLDVEDVLTGITSDKDVEEAKPDPDLVLTALEVAQVASDRAVLVGDTVWDVQAAQRAGVRCVGVLSGGVSEAELRDAGAVAVHRDVAALLDDLVLATTW
jgi:HAD superfamily hydrolase (TIGR01509 family)